MDDSALEKLILELLGEGQADNIQTGKAGRSLSPVEIARAAGGDPAGPKPVWRAVLRHVERIAIGLEREGRLIALRKGRPVPLAEARGVIRYAAAPLRPAAAGPSAPSSSAPSSSATEPEMPGPEGR